MSAAPPPYPATWKRILAASKRILAGVLAVSIVVWLIFAVCDFRIGPMGHNDRVAEAEAAVRTLANSLRDYDAEYGHWPQFTDDGFFLDEQRQARLLNVLRAKDKENNQHEMMFFADKDASGKPGHYRGGFSPETGAFLDPWGHPYRIALYTGWDEALPNPYPDGGPIHASVIVWSLGKDGQQGAPANPRTAKGSDDVMSWQ